MSVPVEQLRLLGKVSSIKQHRSSKIADVIILESASASEYFPEGSCTIVISEKKMMDRMMSAIRSDAADEMALQAFGLAIVELNKSKKTDEVSDIEALRKVILEHSRQRQTSSHFLLHLEHLANLSHFLNSK